MKPEAPIDNWQKKADEISATRHNNRKEVFEELRKNKFGIDNLLDTFSICLKCHNCMRVCPVDYCQLCYFESDDMKHTPDEYFLQTRNTGSLRFPTDSIQYHLGRILHMSMSCVACGTCEDACPMSIPIAQIYSSVGQEIQNLFEYVSGRDSLEPLPLSTCLEEEFTELEG
jgi:formate dehydrogenase subunit beta